MYQAPGGYGPNVATDAAVLELQNVNDVVTELEDGDRLRVTPSPDQYVGPCSSTSLQILVKDALNRTITLSSDAGISFRSNA